MTASSPRLYPSSSSSLGSPFSPTAELSIIVRLRTKLVETNRGRTSPYTGIIYLGRKEWADFEEYARKEWMVNVYSFGNNWIAGTPVKKEALLAEGLFTVEERNAAVQAKKDAASQCDTAQSQQAEQSAQQAK